MRLIRVSKATELPVTKATLYTWRTKKIYPEIFTRLHGAVFVDVDQLEKLLEANRGK